MRSNSSVVTPGATALPASARAPAAIRPATRIFSITSGVCTQGSLPSWAVGLPTYSGRGMRLGTGSIGDNTPGDSAVRAGMPPAYRVRVSGAGCERAAAVRRLFRRQRTRNDAGSQILWRRSSERRGPRMVTEPHTTRPVSTTCGLPSPGASLRRSPALPT